MTTKNKLLSCLLLSFVGNVNMLKISYLRKFN
jgi:hypothetical protein